MLKFTRVKLFYLSSSLQAIRNRFDEFGNLNPMLSDRVAARGIDPSNFSRRIPNNYITLHCDASVSNGAACMAAVAKNADGKIVAVRVSRKTINIHQAAEALAILNAIQWALEE